MLESPLIRWLLGIERIPPGAEGVRLAWEHGLPAWVWALIVLALGLFAVWSYSRLVGQRAGRGILAGVRFAVLLLLIALVAGPMLELKRETIEQDWVLLLTDRSESMTIADAGPTAARESRDRQLREALARQKNVFDQLGESKRLLWLGFHSGAFDLNAPEDPEAVLPVDLGDADGRRTNLDAAIEQALQRAAARPISGVVVFTDGRTSTPPSRTLLRRLEAEQIRVYTVPLGSSEPLGDLAVRRVDAPRRAFVRDQVPVVVEFDQFGAAARAGGATVTLIDEATGEALDRVEIAAGDDVDRVTLTAEPKLAGDATWRVEIETPRPDLIPDNNIKTFEIALIDRPLRVLYVEGYSRWEYRFLKEILVREESIESSIMLLSADRDFAQEGNMPITRLPRTPEEFAQFDLIILGDLPASFFSPQQLDIMRQHIAERGAGLLWIGGERWMPSSYAGTSLADLLPIRGSLALASIREPVNMIPTDVADRLGLMRLVVGDDVGWPRELSDPAFGWSRLFWSQRIPLAQLKPTAEILATTATSFEGDLLPLVVHMRYGAGQTIYVATDEIWRWRYGRGELLPEQFWIQMVRLLGRVSLAGADEAALLTADPRRLAVGQPMQIELRLLDGQLASRDRAGVRIALERETGEVVAELELRPSGGEGRFAATYLPDTVGQLRVRVTDPSLADYDLRADVDVFSPDDELRRPETDHDLLRSIAAETGGEVIDADGLAELANLPNRAVRTSNPLTERLWDTPLVFILVLLLLTGEWIGRKVLRLA